MLSVAHKTLQCPGIVIPTLNNKLILGPQVICCLWMFFPFFIHLNDTFKDPESEFFFIVEN